MKIFSFLYSLVYDLFNFVARIQFYNNFLQLSYGRSRGSNTILYFLRSAITCLPQLTYLQSPTSTAKHVLLQKSWLCFTASHNIAGWNFIWFKSFRMPLQLQARKWVKLVSQFLAARVYICTYQVSHYAN
jgi:hypothetical protein